MGFNSGFKGLNLLSKIIEKLTAVYLENLTLFVWSTFKDLSFYFCFFQVLFPSGGLG